MVRIQPHQLFHLLLQTRTRLPCFTRQNILFSILVFRLRCFFFNEALPILCFFVDVSLQPSITIWSHMFFITGKKFKTLLKKRTKYQFYFFALYHNCPILLSESFNIIIHVCVFYISISIYCHCIVLYIFLSKLHLENIR